MFPFPSPLLTVRPSSSAAITLPTIASMVAQYDASLLTGATNDSKSTWPDSFGSFTATELTATLGGLLQVADLNGLNTLKFTANRAYTVSTSILNGASAATFITVYSKVADPPPGTEGAVIDGFGTSGSISHHPFSDGIIYDRFGTSVRKTVGNPTPSLTSPRILCIRSATNDYTAHLDGSSFFSTATNTVGIPGTGTGQRIFGMNTSGDSLVGKIAELVIFNAALITADREKMEGYLAWKWGLVANLPGGHTYKSAPP